VKLLSTPLIQLRRFALVGALFIGLSGIALFAAGCQSGEDNGDVQNPDPTVLAATSTPVESVPTETPQAPFPTATPDSHDTPTPTNLPIHTASNSPTSTVAPAPTSTAPAGSSGGSSSALNPTATPKPAFVPARPEPIIPAPPDRDLQELGRRLVAGYTDPKTVLPSEPFEIGQKVDFWISRDGGSVVVSGEVSYISEHVYWIFENGYLPAPEDIMGVAAKFENEVWPTVTEVFGTPLTPGIDGDDRMVVYTSVLRSGVAGYFSAADSYSKEIRPYSNEREALYMSANRVNLTSSEYLSVIAHELQHASHFAVDSSEDSWVNEGLSEVAAEIAGFTRSAASAFVRAPSTSLTAWAQDITISAANYGAANLFFAFIASHYGGNEMLTAISQDQNDGIDSIDSALAAQGFDVTANDVFADWLIANYLSTDVGPYGYADSNVPPVKNIYKRAPDSLNGTVKSFGADYVVTSSGSGQMTIEFSGEAETSLLNAAPHSGTSCWWSNHGDSIDSTLTRSVDLRSLNSASLTYWVNYEIEEFWDYAYVMVSTDDGETWDILDTERAINYNPNGNAYGAGMTGTSPGWVQDSVDLSDYAGQQVLLRFEYITDDAVFSKGACFDDFEIPELDWSDNTSTAGDWVANGFARVEETIPTQYLVQVIHEKDVGDPVVYQIPIGANAKGSLTVEDIGDDDLIVAVVSALTRHSTIPTEYTLSIKP
jgi:immune inhibitor A